MQRPVRDEPARRETFVQLEGVALPVRCLFNDRARRYRLGLDRSGHPRLTIPRRGSLPEARRFAQGHVAWLQRQIERRAVVRRRQAEYSSGNAILFRGEPCRYEVPGGDGRLALHFAGATIPVSPAACGDNAARRQAVLRWLRALAARELPARTLALAAMHGLEPVRVSVRNQRTRWGSCSNRRIISLNWRLVQTPEFVRDYIILHELMHLREMNHSQRYWRLVSDACPDYLAAESWLKAHNNILASGD